MNWEEFCEKIKINNGIEQFAIKEPYKFKILYFADKSHKKVKFRPWIIFRLNNTDLCCMTIMCTTSPKKLLIYKFDEDAGMCVLQISEGTYPSIFTDFTYIDCNIKEQENRKTFNQLQNNIDWNLGVKTIQGDIPQKLTEDLVNAIVKSPFTPPYIKVGFKNKYAYLFN